MTKYLKWANKSKERIYIASWFHRFQFILVERYKEQTAHLMVARKQMECRTSGLPPNLLFHLDLQPTGWCCPHSKLLLSLFNPLWRHSHTYPQAYFLFQSTWQSRIGHRVCLMFPKQILYHLSHSTSPFCITYFKIIYIFIDTTGIWTWGFPLARQVPYGLSHASSPFFPGFLEIGFCFLPRSAWTMILLFYASHHCWVIGSCHHTQLFSTDMGSCKSFLLVLALNHNPPDHSLPSSEDYRCELVCSAHLIFVMQNGMKVQRNRKRGRKTPKTATDSSFK
jgi:hypothetical protein